MAILRICFKINSAFSSYFRQGLSDLFIANIRGTPQLVMRMSLFKLLCNRIFFSSSVNMSFIKAPSSSNLGSVYNFILSSTIFVNMNL